MSTRNVIRVKCPHLVATWRTPGCGNSLFCGDCKRYLNMEEWTEVRITHWKGWIDIDNGTRLSTGIDRKGPKVAMKDAENLIRYENYGGLATARVVKYTTVKYVKGWL